MAKIEDVLSSLSGSILPEEIMMQILSQLPIKTLMKFRCVKKSWNDLFVNNPIFVKMHTDHHSSESESESNEKECFFIATRHKHSRNDYDRTTKFSRISSDSKELKPMGIVEEEDYKITGSSNGLVCLRTFHPLIGNCFMLLNPVTCQRKFTSVKLGADRVKLNCRRYTAMGFGFDQEHQDFKIVFVAEQKQYGALSPCRSEAVVYTVNTDSWKKVNPQLQLAIQAPDLKRSYTRALVELRNHLHWRVFNAQERWVMARFDLGNESFDHLDLPKSHHRISYMAIPHIERRGQWGDLYVVYNYDKYYEVWTMVRYGDASSWMKDYTLRYPDGSSDIPWVFCTRMNGDFVRMSPGPNNIQVLSLVSGQSHEVNELGIRHGTSVSYHVVACKESLILINGGSMMGVRKRVCRIMNRLETIQCKIFALTLVPFAPVFLYWLFECHGWRSDVALFWALVLGFTSFVFTLIFYGYSRILFSAYKDAY